MVLLAGLLCQLFLPGGHHGDYDDNGDDGNGDFDDNGDDGNGDFDDNGDDDDDTVLGT